MSEKWKPPESNLSKALRLDPKPELQPYWKAIKHPGLRWSAPQRFNVPPQPDLFTKPGWGYPRIQAHWRGLAFLVVSLIAALLTYFIR